MSLNIYPRHDLAGYGVYDTEDNCWMGDQTGPLAYEEEEMAKIAARILASRMRWPASRLKAMPMDPEANVKRDDVVPQISAEEAMRRLEEGVEI